MPEWVKAGVSFSAFETLWHVRGIVDDQAICRCWLKHKRRWHYEAKDRFFFEVGAGSIRPRL